MNDDFLADVVKITEARDKLAEYAVAAKPWADYRDAMIEYIIARYLSAYVVGKHTIALPDGTALEYDNGENIAVKEEMLPVVFDQIIGATERANGEPYTDVQMAALNKLHKLVVWKPSLSKRDYDKLPDDAKALFDQALQRTRAKPKLTLKETK